MEMYVPIYMNCGTLSGDNSSVNSNKNKKSVKRTNPILMMILYLYLMTTVMSLLLCPSYLMVVLKTHTMKLGW